MLRLFHGGGASEFELLNERFPEQQWQEVKKAACAILDRKQFFLASKLLKEIPFTMFEAINGFGDKFYVLYSSLPLDKYMELFAQYDDDNYIEAFRQIAGVVAEIGGYVRFVAVDLRSVGIGPEPVKNPNLQMTSNIVERALLDAEKLIQTRDAVSGVDRIHTAFHGYLRVLINNCGIVAENDAGITQLFKLLRENHPAFRFAGIRDEEIYKVIRSMSAILDAVNTIRNRASVAHANEELVAEPEAMLVVNCCRTLLHYIDAKMSMTD